MSPTPRLQMATAIEVFFFPNTCTESLAEGSMLDWIVGKNKQSNCEIVK
jgi:hypothetical protein